MWEKVVKFVIRVFSSPIGKVIISGAIDQYVKSNDNELTQEVAETMKKML